MDWNWFFSSSAQSVAALVGVLGAFLISRILTNETLFATNVARSRNLIRASQNLRDRLGSRYFEAYNEATLEDGLKEVANSIRSGEPVKSPPDYYKMGGFSEYVPIGEVLNRIDETVRVEVERAKQANGGGLGHLPDLAVRPLWIQREEEEMRALAVATKSHIREIREHIEVLEDNPERSPAIRVVLVAILLLFWGGVMYPLGALPIDPSGATVSLFKLPLTGLYAQRVAVLVIASVVFTGLVIALGILAERLKHTTGDLEQLREWLLPATYSPFLEVLEHNGYEF